MENDSIVITAKLNVVASEALIKNDLETLEGRLKDSPLKISCTINEDSIKQMQSQLSSLKGLTINANVNAQNIQQSINRATKSQKIEVDITPKIANKTALRNQAKEIEEILGLFDRGFKGSGREQLASLLGEYQKAYSAENYEGTIDALNKIITFTKEHQRIIEVTNTELKKEQESVKQVLKNMEKLYVTTEQLEAIQRDLTGNHRNAQGKTTEAENYLNNVLGKRKWSSDAADFANISTQYWSVFTENVNAAFQNLGNYITQFNEGDIVQGLQDFVEFMGKSTDQTNAYLKANTISTEEWADAVGRAITKVTGTNLASIEWFQYELILSDDEVAKTEDNAQKIAQAYNTIQAAKDLYKDDKSVKSVTADWIRDAKDNLTGFTINVNKATGEVERLKHIITETGKVKFTGSTGSDRGVEKQAETMIKFVNEYTAKLNSLKAKVGEDFAPNISATIDQTTVSFDGFEKKLAELLNGNGNIGELRSEFTALDGAVKNLGAKLRGSDSSLNQFTNAINNARKFDNDLKALTVDYNNLSEKQKESATLTQSLADAQKKLTDLQTVQKTEGYTEKWIDQYRQASIALTQLTADLKLAKKLEQQDTSSAAHKQAEALREIGDAYKEITTLSGKINSPSATGEYKTELERQLAIQNDIVNQTILRAQEEGLINQEFKEQIQLYETIQQNNLLAAQSKRETVQAQNDEIEAEKKHKKELQDVNKLIKDNLSALEKFNNSNIAKNNKNNSDVIGQVGVNTDLITQLKAWQDSLKSDSSVTNVAKIKAEIDALGGSLQTAVNNSQSLNTSLVNSNAEATLEAKIRNLTNQVEIFANTNRRATESLRVMRDGETTFAQGFQNIRDALSRGNLDATGLQRLKEQFQNFRGEADAAGLTVSRFFQSMQSQLRMVLQRWISLYAVIGYIRKMIDSVKELDEAMINLRRVTDETDAGYERFLKNANELARTMKTTTSSLVEQAYQWSKLGYSINEALELAQASTVFMKVADVGQDQALSNLVTVLKAFRLEAGQTMDIVDKLDKLNNRYAVSASGLGQGLERTASAMAMTGNSLEETLALLTGAGEITQNLENTGNALRVISLR